MMFHLSRSICQTNLCLGKSCHSYQSTGKFHTDIFNHPCYTLPHHHLNIISSNHCNHKSCSDSGNRQETWWLQPKWFKPSITQHKVLHMTILDPMNHQKFHQNERNQIKVNEDLFYKKMRKCYPNHTYIQIAILQSMKSILVINQ